MPENSKGKRAVVIGAGISGLAAAQALTEHFAQVVVLERDMFPLEAVVRPGVPQGRQPHGLLVGGLAALDDLFPSIGADFRRAGAHPNDFGEHVRFELPGLERFPKRDLGISGVVMSRPLLEHVMRKRLAQDNVIVRGGCRVMGMQSVPGDATVASISYQLPTGELDNLAVDLVVDASGRGLPTLTYLDAIGQPRPDETTIGVDLNYCSAIYAMPPGARPDFNVLVTLPQAPQKTRTGYILRREPDLWHVLLVGRGADSVPADDDGFLAFAQGLETPTLYNTIKAARRVSDFMRYSFVESCRRHFVRMDAFPDNLIPIGDALCRFNPVYGQGMAVGARQAVVLRDVLRERVTPAEPISGLSKKYLTVADTIIDDPWNMSVIPDLVYEETLGERPPNLDDALKFQFEVAQAAIHDASVHKCYGEVLNLLKPASALGTPEMLERIGAYAVDPA
jgi:2-polyprenyl-6-methoxyphenol hydroxylase-like FAD-dependent oxidoreductase